MKPLPLLAGIAGGLWLVARRHRVGRVALAGGALVVLACLVVGSGLIETPDVESLAEGIGSTLGPYAYALVGGLAFLETGAFIGFVAPGETAVLVGGVVAGQGEIDPVLLVAVVWACAVAGDLASYGLGRRYGRELLLRHGRHLRITEARLVRVESFMERHGGATIFLGRFMGLVRPLSPFIAGTSRMPLRRFLPADVLGAGLWAGLFVTLGYVFWRSLSTVTEYVGRGLFVFGVLVALVVAIVAGRRLAHDPEARAEARAWLEVQAKRPGARPVVRRLRPLYDRAVAPTARRAAGPARFAAGRLTPGDLGLELTTLLAVTAVGGFAFALLAGSLGADDALLPGDRWGVSSARQLGDPTAQDIVAVLTGVGSIVICATVTTIVAVRTIVRRRAIEGVALLLGLGLTWSSVAIAKAAEGRLRPPGRMIEVTGMSYPSGHAAYSISLLACAIVLVRTGSSLAVRFAAVGTAAVVVVGVALSRVYLQAHYVSDVVGGAALGAAIFAVCGIGALVIAFVRQTPSS